MTQATPPGWYPDPGQTNDGPATERRWDGTAWTDQIRPAGAAPAWGPPVPGTAAEPEYPDPPGYPVHPGYPGTVRSGQDSGRGRGRGLPVGIAVAAAVAVLASIGVGVYALTDDAGNNGSTASQAPGGLDRGPGGGTERAPGDGRGGENEEGTGPGTSEPPRVESGSVTDRLSGISLPIPDGWYGQEGQVGAQIMSEDTYDCPGDTSNTCTKGGAYSAPALALGIRGSTAEEVAKADISTNAEESYGGDSYGRIDSHEILESKAVTVAGQEGYLVRWRAVTRTGSDGYVQSLAFPSPARPKQIVVVRFGVDTDQRQSVLDDITEGIEQAEGSGGNGREV